MNATYKRDLNGHYLILHSPGELPDNHEMRTITSNRIPGLLPMEAESFNGETSCRYEISSLLPFSMLFHVIPPSEEVIRDLYLKLLDSLQLFEDYLLDTDHLLLDPEYLYTPRDEAALRMAYVPFFKKDIREQIHSLTESLLPAAGKADDACAVLLIRILGELKSDTFGLSSLRDILEQTSESSASSCGNAPIHNGNSPQPDTNSYLVYSPDLQAEIPTGRNAGDTGVDEPPYPGAGGSAFRGKCSSYTEDPPTLYSNAERLSSSVDKYDTQKSSRKSHIFLGRPLTAESADEKKKTHRKRGKKAGIDLSGRLPESRTWKTAALTAIPAAALFVLLRVQNLYYLPGTTTAGISLLGGSLAAFGFRLSGNAGREDEPGKAEDRFAATAQNPCTDGFGHTSLCKNAPADEFHSRTSSGESPRHYEQTDHTDIFPYNADPLLASAKGHTGNPSPEDQSPLPFTPEAGNIAPETSVLAQNASSSESACLIPEDPGSGLPVIPLDRPVVRIGKISGPSAVILRDETVSRIHAEIRHADGRYTLIDLNSRNGTTAGGRLLSAEEKFPLTDGVPVAFSRCRYVFRNRGCADASF